MFHKAWVNVDQQTLQALIKLYNHVEGQVLIKVLGGNDELAFEEYIRELRKRYTSKRSVCFKVPSLLARIGAHICDVFHATPFSFCHWELLRNDNTPNPNRLIELLGRQPSPLSP